MSISADGVIEFSIRHKPSYVSPSAAVHEDETLSIMQEDDIDALVRIVDLDKAKNDNHSPSFAAKHPLSSLAGG